MMCGILVRVFHLFHPVSWKSAGKEENGKTIEKAQKKGPET
jgi:hypothetical protein